MRIGGIQKMTLVDFPGKVAATVFVQGCNFRCGYCHNPELVLPRLFQAPILKEEVLAYLHDRRKKLQGVVISGGEPTLQKGLADFITRVKAMGFNVKLDTNGSHPEVLTALIELNLLDYIAMDIKSSLKRYGQATGIDGDTARIQHSVDVVINSGVPYQLRTTLVKEFCSREDLCDIQTLIRKADHYVLQPCVLSRKMIDVRVNDQSQYTNLEIGALKSQYDRLKALPPCWGRVTDF